jgi:hypothetical protein
LKPNASTTTATIRPPSSAESSCVTEIFLTAVGSVNLCVQRSLNGAGDVLK